MLQEGSLPLSDIVDGDSVQETVDTSVDDGDLDLDSQGLVLSLLEELSETGTTVEEETSGGIEIGSELGEGGDITVLGKVELEGSSDGLHDLETRKRRGRSQHKVKNACELAG